MPVPSAAAMIQAIVEGDIDRARSLAEQAVRSEADLIAVIEEGFAAGIRRVGELWEEGEYFLPELVQGAEAMKAAMEILRPALNEVRADHAPKGRVVIGTVKGDLHDIGKSLVATLLSANEFQVHDLGSDVPVEAFVAKAREIDADIVAASALLTTTMTVQRDLVRAIEAAGLRHAPRVLVGGAPTTPAWAAEIGAVHAENALRAVQVAREMLA
jgi:corrinoid protein of di/trimethylamine methyltransferase